MAEKTVIVGSGFAAMVAHLCLKESAPVFGFAPNIETQYRHEDFRYNKLLGIKASSYTRLRSKLTRSRLHDRLVQGGNGTIWGGFIDVGDMAPAQQELLKSAGIVLIPLSYEKTGSVALDSGIRQLQSMDGGTLNPAAIIQDVCTGFLERFELLSDGSLRLFWSGLAGQPKGAVETSECRQLILAIGVVQLIDLLYRSEFLREQDVIELGEFKYLLKLVVKPSKVTCSARTIRIGILRGLYHHLGIQRYPRIVSIIDRFIPFAFDQIFQFSKDSHKFKIENGALSEAGSRHQSVFGSSIHYCNLKVNGMPIDGFLQKISPKIVGLGMAFVDQKIPGPISNDILRDALKKVAIEK